MGLEARGYTLYVIRYSLLVISSERFRQLISFNPQFAIRNGSAFVVFNSQSEIRNPQLSFKDPSPQLPRVLPPFNRKDSVHNHLTDSQRILPGVFIGGPV
jgi:hypothetical protein